MSQVWTLDPGEAAGHYEAAGGGSQPGAQLVADFDFIEPVGVHADLVATFAVPVGATVLDMWLLPQVAPWGAGAGFSAGDGLSATAYYSALDLVGGLTHAYDPTAVSNVPFGNFSGLVVPGDGSYYNAPPFLDGGAGSGASAVGGGIPYPAGGTITMTVSGISGGTGHLRVRIIYVTAVTPVVAA